MRHLSDTEKYVAWLYKNTAKQVITRYYVGISYERCKRS